MHDTRWFYDLRVDAISVGETEMKEKPPLLLFPVRRPNCEENI